jgi:opacity protein-like surface antigen
MRKVLLVGSLLLLILASAAPARAQAYAAPFIGWDFGGDAGKCASLFNDCTEKKTSYGIAFGALAGGIFGIEEDIGYAPDFFGQSQTYGDNSVLSAMTNLVVAIPAGPVRPYVSGGLGLMRTHVRLSLTNQSSTQSQNSWAYDLGGGVMFLFPHHLGLRGDYRYFNSLQNFVLENFLSSNGTKLSFHRASVALVIH